MTQREQQILDWITEDPMISQEALAERAGITRSSVAVHISNLMKKGHIVGRGYILPAGGYVVVAGAVNVDIGGQSAGPLVGRDSNPGKVTVSMGGVGRNIAHNLRLLGVKVSLLTALGEDPHAGQVMDSCERLGIDLSRALHVPGGTTSTYLFLSDETGDMALAVSDMGIYEELTPAYFARHQGYLNGAALVVADANLPAGALAYLADHCTAPLLVDHGEGGEGEAHSGEAPHPQAQPHGGGIPFRGEDHRPGQRPPCGGKAAGDRSGAGVYLPGRGGRFCRRSPTGRVVPVLSCPDAQRHRGRGCLCCGPGMGIPGGKGPG